MKRSCLNLKSTVLGALLSIAPLMQAGAAVIHNGNPDLSNDPANPTALGTLALGSNTIVNGFVAWPDDERDYLTFTIAPGQQLSGIFVLDYDDLDTSAAADGDTGFTAIGSGPTSAIPSFATASQFLWGGHVSGDDVGTNLLAKIGELGTGPIAFLGPGVYSFLIQQTGDEWTGYSLDFVVTASPVPLPAALPLLGSASLLLGFWSRRRG